MNRKLLLSLLYIACSVTIALVPNYLNADPAQGLLIAKSMKAQEKGFDNFTAQLKMVLIAANGKENTRVLQVKTREVAGDGDQSIAVFETPADVKGTAFLSYTHISRDDEQWLYLPALKRVKRIALRNKTSPFMGSEFSYEDLASTEVEKYHYDSLVDEEIYGKPCFVIERFPVDTYSGYSKQKVWVEKARYLPLKIEYYNRKGEKIKTLILTDYRQYLKRFWRTHEMRMENHISGKITVLYWSEFLFKQNLNATDFNPASLSRAR